MRAPLTWDMTLEELANHLVNKHGQSEIATLPSRLLSLMDRGTDSPDMSLEEIVGNNAAGTDGRHLSLEGIQEKYTRPLFKLNRPFKGVPADTLCRVWNSRAGHHPPSSTRIHIKLPTHRHVYDVPWDALDRVQ